MSANQHQVGGSHYRTMAIQPFEFCIANDLGGLEHSIVKYVSRWPEKGGIEDLRKARHCINFLRENAGTLRAQRGLPRRPFAITPHTYCCANDLGPLETEVIRWVCFWVSNGDAAVALEQAVFACDRLIDEAMVG